MDAATIRNVNQIADDEKRALEHLVGLPLEPEQHVLILVYKPSVLPNEETRRAARQRIERSIAASQQFALSQGVSAEEADAAVEEAMDHIRSHS